MILKTLNLTNFRSWGRGVFNFNPALTLITGPNASGKTNILEAIYMLATTSPLPQHRFKDVIKTTTTHTKIEAVFIDSQNYEHLLNINFVLDPDQKHLKRSFLISGNKVTRSKFIEQFSALFFEPSDLYFITGSPQRRRRFIDRFLKSFDWEYAFNLTSYQKTLRQRNKTLFLIKNQSHPQNSLWPWNKAIVKKAQVIYTKRKKFIDFFNQLQIKNQLPIRLVYKASNIDDNLINDPKNLQKEINAETTLWGPHRDDFIFTWNNKPLVYYGSRGQHRLAIFQFFMAQNHYIQNLTNQKPLLLLDDVFSELDTNFQRQLIDQLQNNQIIIADIAPPTLLSSPYTITLPLK